VPIGGLAASLYYLSKNQINAQAPVELAPGRSYQVQVALLSGLTPPDEINLVATTPGIATTGRRQGHRATSGLLAGDSEPPRLAGRGVGHFPCGHGPDEPRGCQRNRPAQRRTLARATNPSVVTLDGMSVGAPVVRRLNARVRDLYQDQLRGFRRRLPPGRPYSCGLAERPSKQHRDLQAVGKPAVFLRTAWPGLCRGKVISS
jgi:hypothetical protein